MREARRSIWRSEGRALSDKGWAPLRYWAMWMAALGVAMLAFYIVLTPIWIGLRAVAWLAELTSRRKG
jgi:hypothetical protein